MILLDCIDYIKQDCMSPVHPQRLVGSRAWSFSNQSLFVKVCTNCTHAFHKLRCYIVSSVSVHSIR